MIALTYFFFPLCFCFLELDRYLLELRGGTFPLSAIGSCRGTGGNDRKGRASGMWRRANTSPRKKTSSSSGWSSGGSFREGEGCVSTENMSSVSNGPLWVCSLLCTRARLVDLPSIGWSTTCMLVQKSSRPMIRVVSDTVPR